MTLGEHITRLRKLKKLSQNDLGKKVGTSGDIIGRYERDEVKPSIEVASKIADNLEVSLDYLMGKSDIILDKDLIKKISDIQKLPQEERDCVNKMLEAFLRDFNAKKTYS